MPRRYLTLVLNIVLVLCGGLFAVSVSYLTSSQSGLVLPEGMRRWSVPAVGAVLLVALVARVWLFRFEHADPAPRWPAERSPYPGLEPFTEQETDVFFARKAEVRQLVDRLSPALRGEVHRFIPVVGPSGVGKSSLVSAGLVPRLSGRGNRWMVITCSPEAQPVRNLATSLAPRLGGGAVAERVGADLAADPTSLARLADRLVVDRRGASSVLLVVDQAEELVTLAAREECVRFLQLVERSLAATPRLWVLVVLRSDFLTAFLELGFARLFRNPVLVGALGPAGLHEVVAGPAALAGLSFAPGVVSQLVSDAGTGDALPLLAHTLQALYDRVGPAGRVSMDDYRALGGVSGSLVRQADRVAAELPAPPESASIPETLASLVALRGDEPVRRRVRRHSLTPAQRRVIDAFVTARLLRVTGDGADASVEVVHEALFRQWAPLRQAIAQLADDLRQRAQLESAAHDWQAAGRRDSYLLRHDRLERALEWMARGGTADRPELVREFLDQSMRSDEAAMVRLSETVARQSLSVSDRDPELGMLLALAAVDECRPTTLAYRALLAASARLRTMAILRGHPDAVRGVAWSPDGRRVASAGHDGSIRVWSIGRPDHPIVLRGHEDWVRAVAWSPTDPARLASVSNDHTLRLWDVRAGGAPEVRTGHADVVHAVAWSPSGRQIATASHDRTIRVWRCEDGAEPVVLAGHRSWVRGVAWSPDERSIVSGSTDATVRRWDVATGVELSVVGEHDDWVLGVAWSPDGRRIASASSDGTVRVWTSDAAAPQVLLGHQDWVSHVAWSPDGSLIASVSRDRTARLWDGESYAELAVLRGHADWVHQVAWSPDGTSLATASYDQTVRVWGAKVGPDLRPLVGHLGPVPGVAWSPDSAHLATASHDRTVRIWEARTGRQVARLAASSEWVHDVAWSPDGTRIVTVSRDRTAVVWSWPAGTIVGRLAGHENWVEATAWSPDGTRIATAANDRTARIWDATSGTGLAVLAGHTGWVRDIAWSPAGDRVATVSNDRTCRIWRAQDAQLLQTVTGHDGSIEGVAWSPDGGRLATASNDHTARIWDAGLGSELAVLRGHDDWVRGVSWSPDGRLVATASTDRTARTWDASSGVELSVLCVHEEPIEALAWSPDGRWVATGSRDGRVQISPAVPDLVALVAEARRRVPRSLTPAERHHAMLPG
jgi:WD40 repeat protein